MIAGVAQGNIASIFENIRAKFDQYCHFAALQSTSDCRVFARPETKSVRIRNESTVSFERVVATPLAACSN